MKRIECLKRIFAHVVLLSRKWEVIYNRAYSSDELTLKQFMFLIVIIDQSKENEPSIKKLASVLSTSHQNVKAIVMQLEKKDFVRMYEDPSDKRVTRIKLTEKKVNYWNNRNNTDVEILKKIFSDIPIEELAVTLKTIEKLDELASKELE
jgi:DNA-binding MarR family transcriptional regulator